MMNSDTFTLEGTPAELARVLRCSESEFITALSDLTKTNTACHTARNGVVTLKSRRLEREVNKRINNRFRKQKERNKEPCHTNVPSAYASASVSDRVPGGCKGGETVVAELPIKIVQREIAKHFNREPDAPWSYEEERLLVDLAKRPKMTAEWTEIVAYHTRNRDGYRRQSVLSLLQNWTSELDKARAKPPEVIDVNGHAQANGAMLVLRQKEFDRVTAEMQTIKATYGDHQSWSDRDRKRFGTLSDRKKQLKNELGLTA